MAAVKKKKKQRKEKLRPDRVHTLETMAGHTQASFIKLMGMGFRFDAFLDPDIFASLGARTALQPTAYAMLLANLMSMASLELASEISDVPIGSLELWVRKGNQKEHVVWEEFVSNYKRANAIFESNLNNKLLEKANGGDVGAIKTMMKWRNRERYAETDTSRADRELAAGVTGVIGPRTIRLVRVTPVGNVPMQMLEDDEAQPIDVTPEPARYPTGEQDER